MSTGSFGVCGSGTMGCGIAYAAALAGYSVWIYDISSAALDKAVAQTERLAEGSVQRGKLTPEAAADLLTRVRVTGRLEDLTGCAIVLEAIVEDLAAKQDLFVRLESVVDDQTILATNTSSISITAIAAKCRLPERVVGAHFFNPAHIMKLVEVICGHRTSEQTMQRTAVISAELGKQTVRAKDTPGFIVNRVARNFYGESLRIVGEGAATFEQADRCLRAIGFKMGPFELMDLIGIDVNMAVTQSVYTQYFGEPRFQPHLIQQKMTEAGLLGKKTGKGFYE